MKDLTQIWRGLFNRTYDAVSTTDNLSSNNNNNNNNNARRLSEINTRIILNNNKQNNRKRALTFAFLGIGAILLGLIILIVDPYKLIFQWKLIFSPGGEIYTLWEAPPVELYLKVYLWNVTNHDEFLSGIDKKLKFKEVGPYVYREYMAHRNVTFNKNDTLTSHPEHPLVWVPELSNGLREDDLLILPNIALLSIGDVVSKKGMFTRLGLNVIIRQTNSQPLVEMTAREFMFGYKSALMDLGNTFMPSWIYFDKLGLIDRMYDFRDDSETIFTGQNGPIERIGLIDNYNGAKQIPQWNSPCGNVHGASDGTKFPSYIKPNDTLLFFRKSMCRAKELIHINDTKINGLDAYIYNFATDADDNGHINKKNQCFCKERDVSKCLPVGLLDVRGCYYGFPIALSNPHFLDGDRSLFNSVESGLNPDNEKHRSFLVIQPQSGLPLQLAVRFQINMALGNLKNIAHSDKFTNMILPLLWGEISMDNFPQTLMTRFKFYLEICPTTQTCLICFSIILGILLLLYSIYRFVIYRHRGPITRNFHNNNNNNNTNSNQSPWIEDDFIGHIDRKLTNYIPEKRSSLTPKELEVYLSSLVVTPLNQSIDDNLDES